MSRKIAVNEFLREARKPASATLNLAGTVPKRSGKEQRLPSDNASILVSIAAYRDPQLEPTVAGCLRKASHPERLRFAICWQRAEDDPPLSFRGDNRFRILDIDWRQSRGACWARAETMKLWAGEPWFLQVDSHCRFAPGWDEILIRTAAQTGSAKPILSTYATPFTPSLLGPDDEVLRNAPMRIELQGFSREGIPHLRPAEIPWRGNPHRPIRARFLSAGFLFAPGSFVEEVPYDPDLYFLGEESSMTVRAFTHGYDLFHPAQTILWHDYIRADARKHWGDHTEPNRTAPHWSELDRKSRRKVQRLLSGADIGAFGLGTTRTLAEFEAFAGISFRFRKAQPYTLRGEEPPNLHPPENWPGENYPWIARIHVARAQLPAGSLEDPAAWRIILNDAQGQEIHRQEFTPQELSAIAPEQDRIALICEFYSGTIPAAWTLQPSSRSRGWLQIVSGTLPEEDYAIVKGEELDQPQEN